MSEHPTKEQKAHSPGPWALSHDSREGMEWNIHIVQENAPHLTVCFMTSDGPNEANARLIAAAPDMLEALWTLLPGLVLDRRYADDDDDIEALESRIKTITEAINKAISP